MLDNKLKTPTALKLCQDLKSSIEVRKNQYFCDFVFHAMVIDPRYYRNEEFLTPAQWEKAKSGVVKYIIELTPEQAEGQHDTSLQVSSSDLLNLSDGLDELFVEKNEDANDSNSSSTDAWALLPKKPSDPKEVLAKKDIIDAEFQYLHAQVNPSIDPFDFYMKHHNVLPNLSQAASHFLLASSSSVDSERFFSGATALYQNKSRNKLSGKRAEKLLFIKGSNKNSKPLSNKVQTEDSEYSEDEVDIVRDTC